MYHVKKCKWYTSPKNSSKSCLTRGNGVPRQVVHLQIPPGGYVAASQPDTSMGPCPSGRSEELPGPDQEEGRLTPPPGASPSARSPVAPWGIRPRSHCFLISASRSRFARVAAALRRGLAHGSFGSHPGRAWDPSETSVGPSVDSLSTRCGEALRWHRVVCTFLFDYETNRLPTSLPAGARRDRERQQQ